MAKAVKPKEKKAPKEIVKKESYDMTILERYVIDGDLKNMTPAQKVKQYLYLCRSYGLDPTTKPFDLLKLQDKEILYANKSATEQLRKIHGVSVVELHRAKVDGLFEVTVKVQDRTGRTEISTASVSILHPDKIKKWSREENKYKYFDNPLAGQEIRGDDLAILRMKAETKAKRRATLAICGMGILDESEVEHVKYDAGVIIDEIQGEEDRKRDEALKKIEALPENVKKGFTLLGYGTKQVYIFCDKFQWDAAVIMKEIGKILDAKAAK